MPGFTTIPTSVDESLRRQFERAWVEATPGVPPKPIEKFLPDPQSSLYLGTLAELVEIELELAWKASMSGPPNQTRASGPRMEDYLARFPPLNDPPLALRLVRQEFNVRRQVGDHPSLDEYRRRFPGLIATGRELTEESIEIRDKKAFPRIEGYEITGVLGQGGAGVVYRARQAKLKRDVALKLIASGAAARPDELARFRAEAEAVAQLQHPQVVQIYEVGEHEGCPYLALELVQGGSLKEKIDAGPIAPRRAAEWLRSIALTIQAVHEQGIVHRDLKPANVLLTLDGIPKITDFGLARRLAENLMQTRSGTVLGTPCYASPEQAGGRTREVGPPADVYAMGAILYDMLTGRPPFQADSVVDTILQVLKNDPVSVSKLQPRVSRDLETICHTCLQKEPRRRYASAAALAEDLRRYLAGEPLNARPIGVAGRAWRWSRRNPALAIVGAIGFVALVAVAIIGSALAVFQTRAAHRLAEKQQQTEAALADARARRGEAEQFSAGLLLTQGISMCQAGDVRAGVLWIARAYRAAPAEARDLRHAALLQLSAWGWQVSAPRGSPLRHQANVSAAVFSADGKRLITGSEDTSVTIWETADGGLAAPVLWHDDAVRAAAFSPNGALILTGADDGTARLWDIDGKPVGQPMHHDGAIRCVAFSPDGQYFATASFDQIVRLWRTADGAAAGVPLKTAGPVVAIAFTPDSHSIAAAAKNEARVWTFIGGTNEPLQLTCPAPVNSIAISSDGHLLAAGYGSTGGGAQVWQLPAGKAITPPLPHDKRVIAVAFAPGSTDLFTACEDGFVRRWDTARGEPALPPMRCSDHAGVRTLSLSGDGRRLAAGCADGTIRLWDAHTGQPVGTSVSQITPPVIVALSPDGATAVVGGDEKIARLWSIAPGAASGPATPLQPERSPFSWSADHRYRLSQSSSGDTVLEDTNGQPLGPPLRQSDQSAFARQVQSFAISGDGRTAITATRGSAAVVWNVATGAAIGLPLMHPEAVGVVAISSDGHRVATACADRMVRAWDAKTGAMIGNPMPQRGPVAALAFSPDGQFILSGGSYLQDGSTQGYGRIWNITAGAPVGQMLRHSGPVTAVAFTADGFIAITAGADHTARLWETATGRPIGPPLWHPGPVLELAFDGNSILNTICEPAPPPLHETTTHPTSSPAPSRALFRWRIPVAADATPDLVDLRAQVMTGLELDNNALIHRLDDSIWLARRHQLGALDRPSP